MLCAPGRKSQFSVCPLLEAHGYREVETHRLFKYLNLANTFNLSLNCQQELIFILLLPFDGQVAEPETPKSPATEERSKSFEELGLRSPRVCHVS